MNKINIAFALLVFLLWGCQESDLLQYSSEKVIPEFISSASSITPELSGNFFHFSEAENGFLLFDADLEKICLIDSTFNNARLFGERGEGPDEYVNQPLLSFVNGKVVAIGQSNVLSFNHKGEIISSSQLSLPLSVSRDPTYSSRQNRHYLIPQDSDYQFIALDESFTPLWKWGQRIDNRDNAEVVIISEYDILRVGCNDGLVYRIETRDNFLVIDSLDLNYSSPSYFKEVELVDKIYQNQWVTSGLPIAQQALGLGDFVFIRMASQPEDGPIGFGTGDVRKWLVLRWNPQLELVAEWEVPVEYGRLYTGFVIGPDGRSLIAYEAERGEFHRLPFPERFGE